MTPPSSTKMSGNSCSGSSSSSSSSNGTPASNAPPDSIVLPDQDVPRLVSDNPLGDVLNASLPYGISDEEMKVPLAATQEGVSQCMHERGFEYTKITTYRLAGDRAQHPLDL
jgi:hypothetical protein